MNFQTQIRYDYAFGVPGEIKFDGPSRVQPGFLNSALAAYNIVGATAFSQPQAGGAVVAGGAIGPGSGNVFYGLLVNPKLYASFGTSAGGPLAATMTLPNNVEAEFMLTGYVVVSVPAACNIGDQLTYNTTTGALATVANNVNPPAGFAFVPNAVIDKFAQTAVGGLAVVRLTN